MEQADFTDICSLLETRAHVQGSRLFLRHVQDDAIQTRSFLQLHIQALRLMHAIRDAVPKGARVLLGLSNPCEFVETFFALLYAGCIPVPIAPLRRKSTLAPLESIAAASGAAVAIVDAPLLAQWREGSAAMPTLSIPVRLLCPADFTALPDNGNGLPQRAAADDIAFLQFTSGSTSAPKGAVVTHRNLLANQRLIQAEFGHTADTAFAGWLPLHHDMGFIGNVLQPLYLGIPTTLLSPMAFLERPARLLQAISHYRATTCGMPNFGYAHCIARVRDAELAGVDLSSWQVAFNGAEPIRPHTLQAFAERFAPWGFRRESLYPCYGLAEATLFVAGWRSGIPWAERERPAEDGGATAAPSVASGYLNNVQDVRIVDPATRLGCAPGTVGEIWIGGACIVRGYWNLPAQTTEAFGARLQDGSGPFLRTGDLGFVVDGQLHVTGRLKDLIIVRGKNHYPQDIEASIGAGSPAFGDAACFMADEQDDDRIVVVQEIHRTDIRTGDPKAWRLLINDIVARQHQLAVADVQFVLPNAIPRTTSGKIQRRKCRTLYQRGELQVI
ncbi:fatty acyl-AMP ligase [Chitiniphilus purpureus]|uniref:Fatty acyl-AMP ligase n=1 Tax=Chitiniphilus purpureus TaxID=2981137 RepID=A0ABY6DH30_9NEIS|nr:fatty acyl-AMP ligase [Chitiniphilus sp. CD1]UXY13621.1 fatty acyl-AMP ligase [Chitiniphilus sp. CD1]